MAINQFEFRPDLVPGPQMRWQRCRQIGGSRRNGTIASDLWSGYVTVQWDSGTTETVHMLDIRPVA